MPETPYAVKPAAVRSAYCDGAYLILQMHYSLPDVCVACGQPAWGNVTHREFKPRLLWFVLPPPLDYIYLVLQEVLGKSRVFDFPFCPNCPPCRFGLKAIRLTNGLAIFEGACKAFLDVLPRPVSRIAEPRPNWFERIRWVTYEQEEILGNRRSDGY